MNFEIRTIILMFCISLITLVNAQTPVKVSSGKIITIENFKSEFIASHRVDVWLHENYDEAKKYRVVYMHDGQMLFDVEQAWNKREWKVDEVFSQLINDSKIEPCIVVGIWNNGSERISEYFPDKIFNNLGEGIRNKISSKYMNNKTASGDNYLKFLVEELKPYIDKNFSTFSGRNETFIIGSSMGSLISFYAICEYPDVFGGAACMSTAWLNQIEPGYEVPFAAFDYLKNNLPSAGNHKIYFDYGTGESSKTYESIQSFVNLIIKGKGFGEFNFKSEIFENDVHDEISWGRRLNIPVEFLIGKTPEQKASIGKIDKYSDFQSKFVTTRNVEVWLPDGFSTKKKYSVLYMHDGQMLFDSTTTWNQQSWNVDDVAGKLIKEEKIRDVIVVAVWNSGITRHSDYFPQKPFESLTPEQKDFVNKQLKSNKGNDYVFLPESDNYLKFLVEELKPFIDKKYPVYTDKSNTFIAGSSMGGLISIYAVCEYPDVFGGAACLSTHWPGIFSVENNPVPGAFANYLEKHLPKPKTHKIYFDYGDQTLDALYPQLQKNIDVIMKKAGFSSENWITKFFPGKDHSEKSWNARFMYPLEFLLKN